MNHLPRPTKMVFILALAGCISPAGQRPPVREDVPAKTIEAEPRQDKPRRKILRVQRVDPRWPKSVLKARVC